MKSASNRQSDNKIRRGNERVGGRVGVVSAGEISVVG